jgi:peptidoglycan/LPS O-acetylase OafA/YrhL
MDGLLIGAGVAIGLRSEWAQGLVRWVGRLLPILAVATIFVLIQGNLSPRSPSFLLFGALAVACFSGALIVVSVAQPTGLIARLVGSSRLLAFLGRYSYGIYVLHAPLLSLAWEHGINTKIRHRIDGGVLGSSVFVLLGISISTLLAVGSFHLFERHFLELKRYFVSTPRSPGLADSAAKIPSGIVGPA